MASKFVKLAVFVALAVIMCSVLGTDGASVQHHHHHQHAQRLVRSSETTKQCSENTACGWAVYTKFTRVVDYFMKNTCTCAEGLECIRTDDDVSVSAYVYKCRSLSLYNKEGGATS